MSGDFDLLGDPIPEGFGKRGRPQHNPTEGNRNKVMLLQALGWDDRRIAAALSITKPTLRKHYFRELRFRDEARSRVEGGLIHMLWEQAKEGNVAAAKEFRKLMDRSDLVEPGAQREEEVATTKAEKLGKKAQQLVDAANPESDTPLGRLMAQRQAAGRPN